MVISRRSGLSLDVPGVRREDTSTYYPRQGHSSAQKANDLLRVNTLPQLLQCVLTLLRSTLLVSLQLGTRLHVSISLEHHLDK
jgi:hypothetical protein